MGYLRLELLLLSSALCVNVAKAQDASGNGDPLFIGTIRIESAPAQALLGNDKITEEELEGRNPATMQDVYDGESSVTVSGGAAIGQKVFVNGIEESLLSVTIDGARQNKSAFHHTGNVLLDPELLKSVEISEGLAPADAGPGALAGSIAYTTKDASDLLEDGDNFGGRVSLGTGTNGTGFRTNLALYGQQSGFEYLLSVTRQKGDDYKDGDGVRVVGTEADLTDYVAKFAFTSEAGHKLAFAASQTEDTGHRAAQAGPGGLLFIRPDFFGISGQPSVMVEGLSRRTSYTLTYSNDQLSGWLNPTVQLSYNEQEIDAIGVYGTNTSFSGVVKNEFQLGNGTVTAGLDFFDESAKGVGRGPGPLGGSGREDMVNIGGFAQTRQDLSDRVSVSYGARFDWQEFDAADGSRFTGSGLSANGSIDVILNDQWTFNAGVASSWGGYELGEAALVNFGAPWSYNGFTTSRANAARVGLRYGNGPWEASGALFYTEVNDINAVLPRRESPGNRGLKADLTSKGYDLSLGYNWSNGFARMNYTYANVRLNDAAVGSTDYYLGRPLGRIMALEAGWDVNDTWRIGGTAEIVNDGYSSVYLPGYEVVNLYTTYKPRQFENMEIRLDMRNLLDETYARRSSDGIDFARAIPLNEPGRTVGLTASLKF